MSKRLKLNDQIGKITLLRYSNNTAPDFKIWHKQTMQVLINIFGENSSQVSDFKGIAYSLNSIESSLPAEKLKYLDGLSESNHLLRYFLDELVDGDYQSNQNIQVAYDFWTLIDPKVIGVSKKLFDNGHYSSAVFEAMKLVNNLVKDEVRLKGEGEFDGSSLMDRAFSISKPIISFGDIVTTTGKDIQQGYMHLYKGAILAIRNPKGHETDIIISKERAIHFLFIASHLTFQLSEKIN